MRTFVCFVAALPACMGGEVEFSPMFEVSGRVLGEYCEVGPGYTVDAYSADGLAGTTEPDENGLFSLLAPARTFFEVRGPRVGTTRSGWREYGGPHSGVLLAATPNHLVELIHLVGQSTADSNTSTVAIFATDAGGHLPVSEATVKLLDGDDVIEAQYVWLAAARVPLIGARETQEGLGVALFFAVPEGDYTVIVEHGHYTFPEMQITTARGVNVVDQVRGVGAGYTAPLRIAGQVELDDINGVTPTPEDVTITLRRGPDDPLVLTTLAPDRSYQLLSSTMFGSYDITVEHVDYGPLRQGRDCLMAFEGLNTTDWFVPTRASVYARTMPAYAGGPVDENAGTIQVFLSKDHKELWDTTEIFFDPPLPQTNYRDGLKHTTDPVPDNHKVRCELGTPCTTSADCDAGARCEMDQCVFGEQGPMCSRCDTMGAQKCPAGYDDTAFSTSAGGIFTCYCVPTVDDCLTGGCPDGTFCQMLGNANTAAYRSLCIPDIDPPTTGNNGGGYAVNVPPGTYTITGVSGSTRYAPRRIRIDERTQAYTTLHPEF